MKLNNILRVLKTLTFRNQTIQKSYGTTLLRAVKDHNINLMFRVWIVNQKSIYLSHLSYEE